MKQIDRQIVDEMNRIIHETFKNSKMILRNDLLFKNAMGFSEAQYTMLKKADLLPDLMASVVTGTLGGMAAQSAWLGALGLWGKVLFALSLSSTPIGWIIGGAGLGAVLGLGMSHIGKKINRKIRKKTMIEIPKYINTPLDMIAFSWLSLVIAVAIKLGYADGKFSDEERKKLRDILIHKYGYDENFVNSAIIQTESRINEFSFSELKSNFNKILKMLDKDKEAIQTVKKNLLNLMQDIIMADNIITDGEKAMLRQLRSAIGV